MLMYSSIYALRKVGEALPKKGLGTALVYGGTVVASVGGVAYSTHAAAFPWTEEAVHFSSLQEAHPSTGGGLTADGNRMLSPKELELNRNLYVHTDERLVLKCVRQAPPVGCMLWPAGRVLLEWSLHDESVAGFRSAEGAGGARGDVLEIGSGCGLTALGLAVTERERGGAQPRKVFATDSCPLALANLEENVQRNGVSDLVSVRSWDVSREGGGAPLSDAEMQNVSHLIAADVVYSGGCGGLLDSLSEVARKNPRIKMHLILVDRFSGGTVAGLAGQAGVGETGVKGGALLDPAIEAFERGAAKANFSVERLRIPPEVVDAVEESLSWPAFIVWRVMGTWDGLRLYRVTPPP